MSAKGPDFLVIGAQRSGTTWLHRVLRQHPALWLPPVKELHYFDRLDIKRTILEPSERRRVGVKRLLSLDPWLLSYWLQARNDDWYASLFRAAKARGLLAGETTPAYATLDEKVLARIKRMNERIKLIFVMRDPVERTWSAVNNAAKKGVDASTVEKSIECARESEAAARSAYADTIKRLETVFSPTQIHYSFFENLRDRPKALTAELFSFLGVDPGAAARAQLPKAVNVAAGSRPVPVEFSRAMARDYLPMVSDLCQRFDGPPHAWRTRYETLLNGGRG
jgi:LPS sulfotransferase NodH